MAGTSQRASGGEGEKYRRLWSYLLDLSIGV